MKTDTIEILVVGLGGLGVISLAKSVATLLSYRFPRVITSETRGIAQRRAPVSAIVRAGSGVHASSLYSGGADIVLALEPLEILRFRDCLREGGFCLLSNLAVPASGKEVSHASLRGAVDNLLIQRGAHGCWLPVQRLCETHRLLNKYAGSIMVGAFAKAIDCPYDWTCEVFQSHLMPANDKQRLQAMQLGFECMDAMGREEKVAGPVHLHIDESSERETGASVKVIPNREIAVGA